MKLREPPQGPVNGKSRLERWLLITNLVILIIVLALLVSGRNRGEGAKNPAATRELASRLKAAGAMQQSTELYEEYLAQADPYSTETRAVVAFSLAKTYLELGAYEKALRWFYEAESLGGVAVEEIGPKIVHTLERLGRFHAAQAALEARTQRVGNQMQRPVDDPVVAKIGDDEIFRSEVVRALDDLPPELARNLSESGARQELLNKYVADELMWRKARKLEVDKDPDVLRQHAVMLKQLAIGKLVDTEIVGKLEVDEADLKNFFEVNRSRYEPPANGGAESASKSLAEVRPAVERDYRMGKIQTAYQALLEEEMAASDVELFPENLGGGS